MKQHAIPSSVFMVLTILLAASYAFIAYLLFERSPDTPSLKEVSRALDTAMPEEETPDVFHTIEQQVQKIDATHLIRKYHHYLALFDVNHLLQDSMVIDVAGATQGRPDNTLFTSQADYFRAPEFAWPRYDNVRPLDTIRLTFRGNGIPKNAEKLAQSKLLEPKLQAFYEALSQSNTTVWKSPKTVHFNLRTHHDKLYTASSTPFISIQQVSKQKYARMKSASLPFLWKAYFQNRAEDEESPKSANTETFVSGVSVNSDMLQSLYVQKMLQHMVDPQQAMALKNALIEQRRSLQGSRPSQATARYLNRLSRYDPEFSSLFLINNLFDQYNLFSTFKDGVTLRINAIDTKLNITYISYNIRFDPEVSDVGGAGAHGCDGKPITISDEYFLIATDPRAYLIRVYLPDCHLTPPDYRAIDNFLNQIRIVDDKLLPLWNTAAQY